MRVISGGQIGVDQAALRAAHSVGLPTGGFIPKGYKTLSGPNLLLMQYGLRELDTDSYKIRTARNVKEADGTLRIAMDFSTPGERCTINYIEHYRKPYMDIQVNHEEGSWIFFTKPKDVNRWIKDEDIKILNVAGNARVEMEDPVEDFLKKVFAFL